jgi:drug/metabolite transporter (DMT)-like permease
VSVPTSPAALFLVCTAIWGSTWLAITWQLGVVAPEVSVVYRFALASALIGAGCVATGRSLRFPFADHVRFAAWGAMFFGVNYVAVYYAERDVTSGIVAVVFAAIVVASAGGMRMFYGTPITARMVVAAALGLGGVVLLFLPELGTSTTGARAAIGIAWAFVSMLLATAGNLVAVSGPMKRLPIFPITAWGMFYGALSAALVAVLVGARWTFDARWPYVASLAYLAVFGSVFAFGAYLTLLKEVGAGPASWVGVSTPVVAMLLSTAFEGYRWTTIAVVGVVLAVVGNILALRPPREGGS